MHRIQNFYVGRLIQYIDQGVADVPEGRAETLPAMPGDEDETLSRTQETKMRLQPVAQCRVRLSWAMKGQASSSPPARA